MKLSLQTTMHSVGMLFVLTLFASLPAVAATSPNADTADYVMNDFDYFGGTTQLGGYWYPFTDNGSQTAVDTVYGNSVLTAWGIPGEGRYDTLGNLNKKVFPQGHGTDTTNLGLRFGYIFGNRRLSCGGTCTYPAYVGFGTGFKPYDTLDMTAAAGIAFWAKADSAPLVFNVSIMTRDTTTGAAEYAQSFTLDTTWKLCVIKLVASSVFAQPSYSPVKPFVASRVTGIGFGMNLGDNAAHPANAITIDDLVIQKWKYVDPETLNPPPDALRAKASQANRRFGVIQSDAGLRVRLPEVFVGQSGRVQAMDISGRVIAESPFHAPDQEVELKLASGVVRTGAVHFRVIAAPSSR